MGRVTTNIIEPGHQRLIDPCEWMEPRQEMRHLASPGDSSQHNAVPWPHLWNWASHFEQVCVYIIGYGGSMQVTDRPHCGKHPTVSSWKHSCCHMNHFVWQAFVPSCCLTSWEECKVFWRHSHPNDFRQKTQTTQSLVQKVSDMKSNSLVVVKVYWWSQL